jgi:hypothetical protein
VVGPQRRPEDSKELDAAKSSRPEESGDLLKDIRGSAGRG